MGIKVKEGYEAVWHYHLNRNTGEITEALVEKPLKRGGYSFRCYPIVKGGKIASSYAISSEPGVVYQGGIWFKKKNRYEAERFLIESIINQNLELDQKKNKNIILLEKIREVNKV